MNNNVRENIQRRVKHVNDLVKQMRKETDRTEKKKLRSELIDAAESLRGIYETLRQNSKNNPAFKNLIEETNILAKRVEDLAQNKAMKSISNSMVKKLNLASLAGGTRKRNQKKRTTRKRRL